VLAFALLLGLLGGHALIRACRRGPSVPGTTTAPSRAAAGGDAAAWPRDLEVFVMPHGCWARVVCSDCGPGGCWVGVRFVRSGELAAFRDFELTR